MPHDVREIKELAKKFSPEQIEKCICQQLETGGNVCLRDSGERVMNELTKAHFVRERMDKGMNLVDALRELAGRMRSLYKQRIDECKESNGDIGGES